MLIKAAKHTGRGKIGNLSEDTVLHVILLLQCKNLGCSVW